MARVHFWNFLLNSEGQPIENAEVWVYLAGTLTPADLYQSETGYYSITPLSNTFQSYEDADETQSGVEIIKTDDTGYFEFWVGDNNEVNGYEATQKFKIKWYKAGVAEGEIDYVNLITYAAGTDGQGFEWEGAWATSVTYDSYDVVSYSYTGSAATSAFVCTYRHTSDETITIPGTGSDWTSYWDLFIEGSGTSGT